MSAAGRPGGWAAGRARYCCADGVDAAPPLKALVRYSFGAGYKKALALGPRSGLARTGRRGAALAAVSGLLATRDLGAVLRGAREARVLALPGTARAAAADAFLARRRLRAVRLPAALELLADGCFYGAGLARLAVPAGVREVGAGAFRDCPLRVVSFAAGSRLEKIGSRAFAGTALEEFAAPPALRELGDGAFHRCRRLRAVVLNAGLETLGVDDPDACGAFQNTALEAVALPSTLRRLARATFAWCAHLRQITLPEGLERLGPFCFAESRLARLAVPASVREIGNYAFQGCTALREVTFAENSELARVGEGAFAGTAMETFSAPGALRRIDACAFYDCRALRVVTLNAGLEHLGAYVAGERENYGALQGSAVEAITLPPLLRRLPRATFANCRRLQSAELPERLEVLEERCFAGSGLVRVRIPASVRRIEDQAFWNCAALEDVAFAAESRLEKIGARAFARTKLKGVAFPEGATVAGDALGAK